MSDDNVIQMPKRRPPLLPCPVCGRLMSDVLSPEMDVVERFCATCKIKKAPPPAARAWQAKDIPDAWFLATVAKLTADGRWVMRHEVEEQLHVVPWKVLLAKARTLMKRGLLDGCACGCRGDYVLTPSGVQFLSALRDPSQTSTGVDAQPDAPLSAPTAQKPAAPTDLTAPGSDNAAGAVGTTP